ncbi:MAG: immunity protein YezG family protein [Pseudomonadota bacterium]|nr:immunity protein YezG family protein [Pseudomonadota bacterium]
MINNLYEKIGGNIFRALPDKWEKAWLDVCIYVPDVSLSLFGAYQRNSEIFYFDIDEIDGVEIFSDTDEAFYNLHNLMVRQCGKSWNKCRFELTSDGNFEIFYKYDEDFAYLNNLVDKLECFPSSEEILAIQTWEGLPDGVARSWKTPK